uniref:Uncharacterized protein n=1 Tax=Candidatus Kentrum sp. TUN TaxID=2126343 RepID=A0A450ZRP0_9GAMM|nr:MAG: hypothetical protein BECKTUN1418D_GA0071000_104712 [Candidatus Kentron sp. TUN]
MDLRAITLAMKHKWFFYNMEKKFIQKRKDMETGEEQLFALIKEAGKEARLKKRKVITQHYERLRYAVSQAAASKKVP